LLKASGGRVPLPPGKMAHSQDWVFASGGTMPLPPPRGQRGTISVVA
jgi:hypothetical protein